jgi:hypothetical protein
MGKKHEQILDSMRRTKGGWKATDFRKLYTGYGFIDVGTGGDTKYVHSEYPELFASVSKSSGELATGYACTAVKLIDRLTLLRQNQNAENR